MAAPTHPAFADKEVTKEKLLTFKKEHGQFPGVSDLKKILGVDPRSIQRRGGIVSFYALMSIDYTKKSTGSVRALVAQKANDLAFYDENDFYKDLISLFGEASVHRQSPYVAKNKTLCRSDFKVYPQKGKPFFVDVFSASDMHNFSGCVNIKLRKLKDLYVDTSMDIYFVSLNEEFVSPASIDYFLTHRKTSFPSHIKVLTRTDALKNLAIIST